MKTLHYILISLLLLPFLSSCDRNQVQAEKSLLGTWTVNSIITQYGEFSNNTFVESSSKTETGTLGIFEFEDNMVSYIFISDATSSPTEATWQLNYEKVNSGFIRVPQYILDVGDNLQYEVRFEDSTKNSEKNATNATFTQIPKEGDTELVILTLEKE